MTCFIRKPVLFDISSQSQQVQDKTGFTVYFCGPDFILQLKETGTLYFCSNFHNVLMRNRISDIALLVLMKRKEIQQLKSFQQINHNVNCSRICCCFRKKGNRQAFWSTSDLFIFVCDQCLTLFPACRRGVNKWKFIMMQFGANYLHVVSILYRNFSFLPQLFLFPSICI